MTTGSIRVAMTSDVGLRRKNNQDRKPWTPWWRPRSMRVEPTISL